MRTARSRWLTLKGIPYLVGFRQTTSALGSLAKPEASLMSRGGECYHTGNIQEQGIEACHVIVCWCLGKATSCHGWQNHVEVERIFPFVLLKVVTTFFIEIFLGLK